jgi:hypothetical protein
MATDMVADQQVRQCGATIRQREQALLELDALASTLQARLDDLFRQVKQGQTPWQYQEALKVLGEVTQHWRSNSSGVIRDPEIVSAYNAVVVVAAARLPTTAEFSTVHIQVAGGRPSHAARVRW